MNERELGLKWLKSFQKVWPKAFVYRIPDSPVMRKPFDAMILQDGVYMAIEFKMDGEELLPHQKRALLDVKKNGGVARFIVFGKDGSTVKDETL